MWLDAFGTRRSLILWQGAKALFMLAAITPLLATWLESNTMTAGFGQGIRHLYALQCHQRVGRSFTLLGAALPVCARCYGIYLGLGLAAWVGRPRLRTDAFKAWIVIGLVVLLMDVASEWVGLRPSSAWFRAATGIFVGYGIALAILKALRPRRSQARLWLA